MKKITIISVAVLLIGILCFSIVKQDKNSITIGFLSLLESRPGFTCVAYSYNFNKTWGSAASSLLNAKQDYRPSKHTINEGEFSYYVYNSLFSTTFLVS